MKLFGKLLNSDKDTAFEKNKPDYGEYKKVARFDSSEALKPRYTKEGGEWSALNGADGTVSIMCMGDCLAEPVLTRSCYIDGGYDFRSCFKQIKPIIKKSDLAIANLETIVSDDMPTTDEKHKVGQRYICNAPFAFLQAIKSAGVDAVCMANNHSADGGYDGLIKTYDNVSKLGFIRTGTFKDEGEKRYAIINVKGIKIALFAYAQFYNSNIHNEYFTPKGAEVMLNLYSEEKVRRDVQSAKDDGAEFMLCYIHMRSKEYTHEVTEKQEQTMQALADAGMDCIIGSHSHSLQRYDEITAADGRRVPAIFSMGNFITSDNTSMITRYNVIYNLILKKGENGVEIARESVIPCRIVENTLKSGYVIFPTQTEYRNNAKSTMLDEAQEKILGVMGDKIALSEIL